MAEHIFRLRGWNFCAEMFTLGGSASKGPLHILRHVQLIGLTVLVIPPPPPVVVLQALRKLALKDWGTFQGNLDWLSYGRGSCPNWKLYYSSCACLCVLKRTSAYLPAQHQWFSPPVPTAPKLNMETHSKIETIEYGLERYLDPWVRVKVKERWLLSSAEDCKVLLCASMSVKRWTKLWWAWMLWTWFCS